MDRVTFRCWRKSSRCANGSTCVEVTRYVDTVAVRDSGNGTGQILHFTIAEWTAFTGSAKARHYDV